MRQRRGSEREIEASMVSTGGGFKDFFLNSYDIAPENGWLEDVFFSFWIVFLV